MNVLVVELPSGDLNILGPFQFWNQAEGWAKENLNGLPWRRVSLQNPSMWLQWRSQEVE